MSEMSNLYRACKIGDLESATHYSIDKTLDELNKALIVACECGYIDVVRLLISKGANDWQYGFINACERGHVDVIHLMISNAINANKALNWYAGLNCACEGGYINVVHLLISLGVSDFAFGFEAACQHNHMEIAKLLYLKSGFDWSNSNWNFLVHLDDVSFWSAGLTSAYKNGHVSFIKFMISQGAKNFNRGLSLVYNSNIELAQLMIASGATNVEDFYFWPAGPGGFSRPDKPTAIELKLKSMVSQLLYLGTPLSAFSKIYGYQDLVVHIDRTKASILKSNALVLDLLTVVAKYIII